MKKLKPLIILVLIVTLLIAIGILFSYNPSQLKMGDWRSAFKKEDAQVFYLGRPTCSWCQKMQPGLINVTKENKLDLVYINTDQTTQAELTEIFNFLEIDAKSFGTPYLVVIKNKKVVEKQVGYQDNDQLISFFKRSELIN